MGVWVLDHYEYSMLWENAISVMNDLWKDDNWFFASDKFSFDPEEYYVKAYQHEFPFGTSKEYLQFNEDFCHAVIDPTIDVIWFTNGYSAGSSENVEEMSYSILNLHDCIKKNPQALEHRKTYVGYSAIDYILAEIYFFNYGYVVHANLLKNLYDRGDETIQKTHEAIEASRIEDTFVANYEVTPLTTASKEEKEYEGQVLSLMFNCASVLYYDRGILDFENTIAFLEFIWDPQTVSDLNEFADDIEDDVVKPMVILVGCIEKMLQVDDQFQTVYKRLMKIFEEKNIPVFGGVKFGHIDSACSEENYPIIFGREATLYYDGESDSVELEVFLDEDIMFQQENVPKFSLPEKFKKLVVDLGVQFDLDESDER